MNTEIFELRAYPEPNDVETNNDKYILFPGKHTLKQCEEIIDNQPSQMIHVDVIYEYVAVDSKGKRYFAPRDGFDWMDVTKTEEV